MRRNFWILLIGVGFIVAAGAGVAGAQEKPELPSGIEAQMEKAKAARAAGGQENVTIVDGKKGESKAPETPQERPKSLSELVEQWMTPIAIPRASMVRIDDKYAYPHSAVPLKMEIVKEEGDTVWLKGIPPEDPESAMHKMWLEEQNRQAFLLAKREFDEKIGTGEYVDFKEVIVPPNTIDAVAFEVAEGNLPRAGLWQMSFDFADMNGDGELDIILPPGRKGQPAHPLVFVGDGKGGFNHWTEPKWHPSVPFDYGDVEVADFDGDGFLDIVIAIHFKAQFILYGSEDHQFRRYEKLPSPDPRITSRAVTVADFDGDGRLDVAFQAELDMDMPTNKRLEDIPTVWIVHNTENGWRRARNNPTEWVIGDRISSADLDGDGFPDLVVSAGTAAWRAIVFLNRLDAGWETLDESKVMGNGFHFDNQPYRRVGAEGIEEQSFVYGVFEQFFRTQKGNEARTGFVRYSPTESGDWSQVTTEVIHFDDDDFNYYFRLAVGDLNGDGLEDIVVGRKQGGLEVWIQTEDGQFFQNMQKELDVKGLAYDLRIIDLDGDGWGDIVASMADLEAGPGGVFVWYSRPVV
ncbi:MAG: VCBS repeat-containing protein [Thermoanaerobaculales bacterium]|nr:VCBS repeat-containing protein [Thermoanaerobaculales bacterium]